MNRAIAAFLRGLIFFRKEDQPRERFSLMNRSALRSIEFSGHLEQAESEY